MYLCAIYLLSAHSLHNNNGEKIPNTCHAILSYHIISYLMCGVLIVTAETQKSSLLILTAKIAGWLFTEMKQTLSVIRPTDFLYFHIHVYYRNHSNKNANRPKKIVADTKLDWRIEIP